MKTNNNNIEILENNIKDVLELSAMIDVEKGKEIEVLIEKANKVIKPNTIKSYRRQRSRETLLKLKVIDWYKNSDNHYKKVYRYNYLDIENSQWVVSFAAKYTCFCPCSEIDLVHVKFPISKEELDEAVKKAFETKKIEEHEYNKYFGIENEK